jgi:hypothetical protein
LVATALKRERFVHVRLEFNKAGHTIDAQQQQHALTWFGELAALKAPAGTDAVRR